MPRGVPKTKPEQREPIRAYGCPVANQTQFFYDQYAFAKRLPVDFGCPTRTELFKRITNVLLPNHFEWHDWTDRLNLACCNGGLIGIPGCSNSAKTFNISSWSAAWWLCRPAASSVMLVSTSRESLRKRAWAIISKCFTAIPGPRVGNFVDSRMIWQIEKGDAKHAIFGKAVEEGSITKVADDIKGVHTIRQMVIIDEATAVPEAIFDAVSNLYSYPEEFILVVLGNPRNRLDQFGKFIEPSDGWSSITVEDEEWDGKPQAEYGGQIVKVIRFDAEKSPNIVEGKVVSKHLPTKEKVEAQRNAAGGQTPLWWSNFRGFPPPDGLSKTVFTESAISSNQGFKSFVFTGNNFKIIGAFDHARDGGDRPALRFAKLGEIETGKMGIEWMAPIIVPINAASQNPIDFQLAEQVQRHCEHFVHKGNSYSCAPEDLIVDGTGEGAGFADIIQRVWSMKVRRVVFGWGASEDSVSLEDSRAAKEVYENKRAEMYFRTRSFLDHGQLRGIDRETAVELCTIEFDDSAKRIKMQKKADYKKKFKKSPDLADCGIMLTEIARINGVKLVAVQETAKRFDDWDEVVRTTQAVYDNDGIVEEDLEEVEAL